MSLAEIDAAPAWDPAAPAAPSESTAPGRDRTRARLVLVPEGRPAPAARRLPFVVCVLVVLAVGLGGLLLLNTKMQQDSVQASRLAEQSADLQARRQSLAEQLDRLRSPASLAAAAARMGLVPQTAPPILDLGRGTVTQTGR